MIKLTRLNKSVFYLNPDLLQCIDETPDTVLTLINGDHLLVLETANEIIDKIIDFRVTILQLSHNKGLQDSGKTTVTQARQVSEKVNEHANRPR